MSFRLRIVLFLLLLLVSVLPGSAAVTKVEITQRGPLAGNAGYEYLAGEVFFAVDPNVLQNKAIADIALGPKDSKGAVEFSANLFMIRPREQAKSNRTALVEVSNRGGKSLLYEFDFAHGTFDPKAEASLGDQFLLQQGYTLVWLGWEFDVPEKPGMLRARLPVATQDDKPITGRIRAEWIGDQRTDTISTGDKGQTGYPVLDAGSSKNRLFVRSSITGERKLIPHAQWNFSDASHVTIKGGFTPGLIYEVVYETQNPPLAGLGMAGFRDYVAYLKHEAPQERVQHAIGFGVSQSGRFLRDFLYQGFNQDEKGREVFDGVWAHVAGAGRGSFNERFAQPSRDGQEFNNIFYPVDVPPFDEENLLAKVRHAHAAPKLFLTNGSSEYWSRCASLIHTTADGKADVPPSPMTRIYFFSGSQHTVGMIPADAVHRAGQNVSNTNDYRFALRALLEAMQKWVAQGQAPPASVFPELRRSELTTLQAWKFPHIAGINLPMHKREAYRLNFATEPPQFGTPYPTFVPQVDADGNDRGGIQMPEIAVPLASYTGWNLRQDAMGAPDQLVAFLGSWIPFPRTRVADDPRRPVADRYSTEQQYLAEIDQRGARLAEEGFVLREDLPALHARASREWTFYMASAHPLKP